MKPKFSQEELQLLGFIAQSVWDLCPNTHWELPDPDYNSIVWLSPEIEPPSFDDVMQQVEVNRKKHEDLQWRRDRVSNYPSVTDQLDMMYHANALPQELQDLLRSVKETYPKPTGL